MKTLYIECNMGAAGDMLMAALLELHPQPADFINRLNHIGMRGVTVYAEATVKCGIQGTHIRVKVNGREEGEPSEVVSAGETPVNSEHFHGEHSHGEHSHGEHSHGEHSHEESPHAENPHTGHSHSDIHEIGHLIGALDLSDSVRENAMAVYQLVAEAESHVHGVPVEQIHFHEVGEMDAVADIVGVCMLMEELAPEHIIVSEVNTGSGQVRCAHGILPVPAPATAYLLRGIPIFANNTRGELCTPTGAALLKHFAGEFRNMPTLTVTQIGYGCGSKDFEQANCVRAYLGESAHDREEVAELICNLDDMTPEAVAFAQQLLMEEGALDVYTTPIGMKKGRLGVAFTCMCRTGDREKMLGLMFKHTTTLGIRENILCRHTLDRETGTAETGCGCVEVKVSRGYGVTKTKPEYEDMARIAREKGLSLAELYGGIRYGN